MNEFQDFQREVKCCQCPEKSRITLFSVANSYTGRNELGVASQFSKVDSHNNPTWQIRDGLSIRGAFGYCTDCYREHMSKRLAQEAV